MIQGNSFSLLLAMQESAETDLKTTTRVQAVQQKNLTFMALDGYYKTHIHKS